MNTNYITIGKVKYDGDRVIIKYTDALQGNENRYELDSFEKPSPAFISALQALRKDVIIICELELMEADLINRLNIRGISLSHKNEVMGATITALLSLRKSNAPLVINTPHKPEEPYAEGADDSNLLPVETADRIYDLIEQAKRYIDGVREQTNLFDKIEQSKEAV